MSYSAMTFLILAILAALLGFVPDGGALAKSARVLAMIFTVLCVAALLLPYVRRQIEDSDRI